MRIVLLLLLLVSPAAHAQLNVQRIEMDNCVIMLEQTLMDEQAQVVADIQSAIAVWHAHDPGPRIDTAQTAQRWAQALANLLDLPMDGPQMVQELQELRDDLDVFNEFRFVLTDRPTVYVLRLETIGPYIRAGGELPGVSHDADSFTTSINMGIENGQAQPTDGLTVPVAEDWETGSPVLDAYLAMAGVSEMPPDAEPELIALATDFSDMMESMIGSMRFMAIYGCTIRLLGQDENQELAVHARWLHSGLIDYIAFQALRDAGDEDYAQQVQEVWLGDTPADPERPDPAMLLRYWTAQVGTLGTSGDALSAFNRRRRIRAAAELQRMVDTVGLPQVIAIARQITEQQHASSQATEQAIAQATGYDIAARLDLYEPDVEDVYYDQILSYRRARDAGDPAAALVHAFCALQVQVSSDGPVNSGMYQAMRIAAQPFPDADLWFAIRETFFDLAIAGRLDEAQDTAYMYLFDASIVALDHNRPEMAYDMLEHKAQVVWPEDNPSAGLAEAMVDLIDARRQIDAGDFAAAEQLMAGVERAIAAEQVTTPQSAEKVQQWVIEARIHFEQARAQRAEQGPGVAQ